VTGQLKGWGADRVYLAIRDQLTAEASRTGHPETIARQDLSRFLVQEGIVPGIMTPIRSTARSQQLPLIVMAVLIMIGPPLGIRLMKKWLGPAGRPEVNPPPARPGSP
jgi:hypothetical protein